MRPANTEHDSYIPSTEAAVRFGLTNDHIASLCRRGKVEGRLSGGRLWFVDEASLGAYIERTNEERKARHRKLSQKIKDEYAAPQQEPLWRMPRSVSALAVPALLFAAFYFALPGAVSVSVSGAQAYLQFIDAVGDVQAQSYITMGEALADAAEDYAAVVYAFGDGQEFVYEAIRTTLNESTETIGANTAAAILSAVGGVYDSADGAAQWYKRGSELVVERTSGQ